MANEVKNELNNFQNLNVFQRMSPKQFSQVVEAINLYVEKLEQREASLNEKERNLNTKKEELRMEESELAKQKRELESLKEQAKETINIFREQQPTMKDASIPDESITRDKLIISELDKIKDQARELKEMEDKILDRNKKSKVELTESEKESREERLSQIRNRKNEIKAIFLGIVAAYRDLLPREQIMYLEIQGKSFARFLKDELESIIDETPSNEKVGIRIDDSGKEVEITFKELTLLEAGYLEIARNPVIEAWAGPAYSGASYDPFESGLSMTDNRRASMAIYKGIIYGNEKTLNLRGKNTSLTRSTQKMSEQTPVEEEFSETIDEFKNSSKKSVL